VSIDNYRRVFLAVVIIALLVTFASLPTLLTFIGCAITIGCAIWLFRLPEQRAGYFLGALAIISSGVVSVALVDRLADWPPPVTIAIAIVVMGLTAFWLMSSWNKRMPVRHGQQVNVTPIFGPRQFRGPTRIRRPRVWLGSRIISTISLRPIKTSVRVNEIDVCPAADSGTTLRIVRPEASDLPVTVAPRKIHEVEMSLGYRLNGANWFLLYNVPHADQYTSPDGHSISRDQPEYWEAIATGFIEEEAPEVLRRVIHREGWSATAVRDQREVVAEQFQHELSEEAARMGIIIEHVELLTVDVDAPEALRAARNTSVLDQEAAESQARVGSIRIGLHGDILRQMQELLSDREHHLPPEAIAAIVRSQIRELSRSASPRSELEDVLEDRLDVERHTPTKAGHNHQRTRGAA